MAEIVSVPRAARQLLAYADTNPLGLLVCALTLSELDDRSLGVTILATPRWHRASRHLTDLLEHRGIECVLYRVKPHDVEQLDRLLAELVVKLSRRQDNPFTLDVSSTSAAQSLILVDRLSRLGVGSPTTLSYDQESNTVRVIGPLAPAQQPQEYRVDIGALDGKPVTPADVVDVFEIRGEVNDPYGAGGPGEAKVTNPHLVAGAHEMVRAARDTGGLANFRGLLQGKIANTSSDATVVLPAHAFADRLQHVLTSMVKCGLATVEDRNGVPHSVLLVGTAERGGPFFLAGGWLEVAVAAGLARGLPDRPVFPNFELAWGRGRQRHSTYGELDVAFVYQNRLHLVSCKNSFEQSHLLGDLYKVRAITAELGETWVRPTIASTETLRGAVRERLEMYEIGSIHSGSLLTALDLCLSGDDDRALVTALNLDSMVAPQPGTRRRASDGPAGSHSTPGARGVRRDHRRR